MSSFRAFPSITVNGTTFRLYESNKTGLRGLLMETGEPLCNIQCVIATESDTHDWTHKDDGLPHTLEHAIFMGSELFPYKGILDKLANRCLASGTNAWTATDHTCYTMESAGHEGCLNLLPIYADHILHPTLTDACFHTEVHHVTGEGEDKGVVYCEMQARENGSGSLVDRAILSLLYPQGGYSSETGGKMANLHTLTNAQVARYHQELYRPDNMCFIVSGTAGEAEFLRALEQVEERVRSKGYARGAKPRPWELPVAPMAAAGGTEGIFGPGGAPPGSPKVVPFPSKDESSGVVSMGWRGPNYDDQATWTQLKLLWQYLTNGAASPLTKGMVEVAEPLCTSVGPADEIFSSGYHQVWFQNAKCETIDRVPAEFYTQLNEALASFDLARMHSVIRLRRRKHLESLERAPTSAMSRHVIEHFLYATRGGADGAGDAAEMASLVKGVDMLPHLEAAEAMATEGWVALATEWILTREVAVVVGKPSATLADEIPAAVTKRQEATKAELGEAGLLQMAELLEKATAQNETPIPTKYLTAVPIPSKASVRSIPLVSIRGSSALQVAPSSGEGIPPAETSRILEALGASCAGLPEGQRACLASYWQEFAHIHSQFVSIAVAVDTSHLTNEQRLHLPLLELMAFKLPCDLDDGTHLSKEEFVTALQGDTVKYNCSTGGVAGGSPQMLTFFIQVKSPAHPAHPPHTPRTSPAHHPHSTRAFPPPLPFARPLRRPIRAGRAGQGRRPLARPRMDPSRSLPHDVYSREPQDDSRAVLGPDPRGQAQRPRRRERASRLPRPRSGPVQHARGACHPAIPLPHETLCAARHRRGLGRGARGNGRAAHRPAAAEPDESLHRWRPHAAARPVPRARGSHRAACENDVEDAADGPLHGCVREAPRDGPHWAGRALRAVGGRDALRHSVGAGARGVLTRSRGAACRDRVHHRPRGRLLGQAARAGPHLFMYTPARRGRIEPPPRPLPACPVVSEATACLPCGTPLLLPAWAERICAPPPLARAQTPSERCSTRSSCSLVSSSAPTCSAPTRRPRASSRATRRVGRASRRSCSMAPSPPSRTRWCVARPPASRPPRPHSTTSMAVRASTTPNGSSSSSTTSPPRTRCMRSRSTSSRSSTRPPTSPPLAP